MSKDKESVNNLFYDEEGARQVNQQIIDAYSSGVIEDSDNRGVDVYNNENYENKLDQ